MGGVAPNLAGMRFGRLFVLSKAESDRRGNAAWFCRCDCGVEKRVLAQSLRSGSTVSCGCYNLELVSGRGRSLSAGGMRSYLTWDAMIQRCTNPRNKKWHRYGGRGIIIHETWRSFDKFLADMGERPEGMTLDRINNDGNYEPTNCRWATPITQGNNRGNNRVVKVGNSEMTVSEASRLLGGNRSSVRYRLANGWSEHDAVSTPLNSRKKQHGLSK